MSTEKGVKSKLDRDYATRRASITSNEARRSTYLAVTARRFSGKQAWISTKQAEDWFLAVQILDADDLATWLEQAPSVACWFSRELGHPTSGALDLDSFLSRWEQRTIPPLPVSLVLAGNERTRVAQQVSEWLTLPNAKPLLLRGDTREEALLFVAAAIAQARQADAEQWRAQTLIVDELATWRWLLEAHHATPPILLPRMDDLDAGHAAQAQAKLRAHVLLPLDARAPAEVRALALHPLPFPRIREELVRVGIEPSTAERLARASGGRLTALQRLFQYVRPPEWADHSPGAPLLVLLLIGAWDPHHHGDQEAIRRLGGIPEEVERLCAEWSGRPDAPLEREHDRWQASRWRWVAPLDAWRWLARRLTDSLLHRFEALVAEVLGERDRRYELPAARRFLAPLEAPTLACSNTLREGLAQSLVMLALNDAELAVTFGHPRGSHLATSLVARLLKPDWRIWASLAELLPVLAEAAPVTLLECVERSLDEGEQGVAHLLAEESSYGPNPHTGLLWALEGLGWCPDCVTRVAYALAQLARHDPPDNRLANRPLRSLTNLLDPVLPQSATTRGQRLAILAGLLGHPVLHDVGWQAGLELYTEHFRPTISFPSHRPRHRPWPLPDPELTMPDEEAQAQIEATLQLLLEHVQGDAVRWSGLLGQLWRLPSPQVARLLEAFEQARARLTDPDQRVWATLRQLLAQGYEFGESWGISPEQLAQVARLYAALTPEHPVARIAWLFCRPFEIPEAAAGDWERTQQRLSELRVEAISSLFSHTDGWSQLEQLIGQDGVDPDQVGRALAGAVQVAELEPHLLSVDSPVWLRRLLPAFVAERSREHGPAWLSQLLGEWQALGRREDAWTVALALPQTPELWAALAELGEPLHTDYWQRVPNLYGELTPEPLEAALAQLLAAGNCLAAAYAAGGNRRQIAPATALQILEQLNQASPAHKRAFKTQGAASLYVERLFLALDRAPTSEGGRVALLEAAFAGLLRNTKRGLKRLNEALNEDPALVVLLLGMVYLAEQAEQGNQLPAESSASEAGEHAAAVYAWLTSWQGYPGEGAAPEDRERQVLEWSREVLAQSIAHGLMIPGRWMVAQVLARVPAAPDDDLWPCRAARHLLEEGQPLAEELFTARYNARGATIRAVGAGGQQERDLASGYADAAARLAVRWPRTAALLTDLAQCYRREAEEHDAAARTERQRFGLEPSRPASALAQPAREPDPVGLPLTGIKRLALRHVGPASGLELELAPRLTLLTGDNSAGKTFVLEVLWWTLTGSWVGPAAWPRPELPEPPEIAFTTPEAVERICRYEQQTGSWLRPASLGPGQLLVVYARVNGALAVWDPLRSRVPTGSAAPGAFLFGPEGVWDILARDDGTPICNGLVRDLVDWQYRRPDLFQRLGEVLEALAPPGEPLALGTPRRISMGNAVDQPTVRMSYGDVPILHSAAAVRRVLSIAYLLVWSWFEHREAARLAGVPPLDRLLLLIDEPETHLHPRWQRTILPALFRAVVALETTLHVQVVSSTHSPLVTASLEALFDPEQDSLVQLAVQGNQAEAQAIPWAKQGDVSSWLVSEIFGLAQPRSIEAEQAIDAAMAFVRGEPPSPDATRSVIEARLHQTLPDSDPFLIRWHVVMGDRP